MQDNQSLAEERDQWIAQYRTMKAELEKSQVPASSYGLLTVAIMTLDRAGCCQAETQP